MAGMIQIAEAQTPPKLDCIHSNPIDNGIRCPILPYNITVNNTSPRY